MYIFKNAIKSITRNKLRNILLGIIVMVIAVSACVALSIRQAAAVAKEDAAENMTITAQISFDRSKAMEEMAAPEGEEPGQASQESEGSEGNVPDRGRFDFDILQGSSLTLEEYLRYAEAQQEGDSYYYSGAFSLDATGELLPYGTEEEEESETEDRTDETGQDLFAGGGMEGGRMEMPGGMGGKRFQVNQGDFSITGYSSYNAMVDMFGSDGGYTITDGEMFEEDSEEYACVISNELAMYNDLAVGDELVLCNPECEEETYTFTVCGIYENESASSQENNRFAINDPANNIYISYPAAAAIIAASEEAANTTTDSSGEETSAALKNTLAFTYTFVNEEHYETFAEKVYDLGLDEDYTVSSMDIEAFESSMTPLETLSKTALWFFVIVLIVGGIILVTLNIFNLRERKYEVGVLTAIGMKKAKVAVQFIFELFLVTFAAIIIGGGAGAAVSVPVTNSLLESQIEDAEQEQSQLNENFGFEHGGKGSGGEAAGGEIPGGRGGAVPGQGRGQDRFSGQSAASQYVSSVTTATNAVVILQLAGVGLLLTVISGLAALISIMRYEPLKILSSRT